jgi:hypothetical protein
MELDISFGKHRADTNWKPEYLTWDEFIDRLRKVRRTAETMAQYDKLNIAGRGKVKDGRSSVGLLGVDGEKRRTSTPVVSSRWTWIMASRASYSPLSLC